MKPWATLGCFGLALLSALLCAGPGHAQGPDDPWPRTFELAGADAALYQPQVESWKGNRIEFRAVLEVKPKGTAQETYGTVWATARTEVDRVSRMVTLEDLSFTKSKFPALPDQGSAYLAELAKQFGPAARTVSLDRLEASFAASGEVGALAVPVKNDPPHVFVSSVPAVLVSIQGAPVARPVPGTRFERVINTRALVAREVGSTTWYLHVYDGWLFAGSVQGPWYAPMMLPPGIDALAAELAKTGEVDLVDGGGGQPKPSLSTGAPAIFVSETPAELLVFHGQPEFVPIEGTGLRWASNTASDVVLDPAAGEHYVLLSGRWYRAKQLTGPWTYVPSNDLPPDFRRIPTTSPAAVVLASVAGTPQAQEAVIANSIPQTATVKLADAPKPTVTFDGAPQFRPVEGTPLEYAVNGPVPVIRTDASTYYALQAGIWYVASAPTGPWIVATTVPATIYTIPPPSPIHYVTYVRIYGATSEVVYVGYTPGYLGTVTTPDGVVVYGTGYAYTPWVGTVWYPPPVTYGVMAQPVYNPAVGMAYGYALGVTTAAVAMSYGAAAVYHPAYYGYPCCGSTSAQVYGQHGSTSWSGTREYYEHSDGSYGTSASGTYHNEATGTSGSYQANKSYNPYTGQQDASYSRTANTPAGGSGQVSRSAEYNNQTGAFSSSGSASATGAAGQKESYSGSSSYDPSTHQAQASTSRTASTPQGGSASAQRSAGYNTQTGAETRSGSATATGAGGRSESVSGSASSGSSGDSGSLTRSSSGENASKTTTTTAGTGQAPSRQTTVTNEKTGESKSVSSGQAYASKNGDVYKPSQSGSGWQQHTPSGWKSAGGDTSWADREQQARSQGEERSKSFQQGGGGRSGGGGGGEGRSGGGGGRSGGFHR